MSYKIEFSKKAFEDLELIKKYIYENDELATQKIVSYIVERIETIIANRFKFVKINLYKIGYMQ